MSPPARLRAIRSNPEARGKIGNGYKKSVADRTAAASYQSGTSPSDNATRFFLTIADPRLTRLFPFQFLLNAYVVT
jgi:hypothetical protein